MREIKLNNLTDIEIIEKVKSGEYDFYEELINRHRDYCMRHVWKMVRDFNQSEELVQDTFVKAYYSLSKYKPTGKFSSWLIKIASNLCLDYFKKRKKYTNVEYIESIPFNSIDLDQSNPLNITIKTEFITWVNRELDALPFLHRNCLLLRCFLGLSYNEISEIVGIPVGTVKSRIFETRKKLREKVNKYEM